jgi:hypothetical protein
MWLRRETYESARRFQVEVVWIEQTFDLQAARVHAHYARATRGAEEREEVLREADAGVELQGVASF